MNRRAGRRPPFSASLHVAGGVPILLACLVLTASMSAAGFAWGPKGMGWPGAGLSAALVWMSMIDVQRLVLPNALTLPLVGAGLLLALSTGRLGNHVLAAFLAYALFATLSLAAARRSGREALGLGDAKLFAASGAWLGPAALPPILLIASSSALILAGGRALITRECDWRNRPIAFGPHLALGFWIIWLVGVDAIYAA